MAEEHAPWLALLVFAEGDLPEDPALEGRSRVRLNLPQAVSWVGQGANEAVTAEQITSAIGEANLAEVAKAVGKSPEGLAEELAAQLPDVVDQATPGGVAQTRREQPAPDILLTLFDEVPDTVTIRDPGQGIHFGLDSPEVIRLS